MDAQAGHTVEGEAATQVVLATFRANGLLLVAGDELAAEEGLTSARWQVLGAIALEGRPLTVPQIARRMGLSRQAVQASVNRLLGEQLVEADVNPDHRRSPLIHLTERGDRKYNALQRRQAAWINGLAAGLKRAELVTTARVLDKLSARLETNAEYKGDARDEAPRDGRGRHLSPAAPRGRRSGGAHQRVQRPAR
jgi:DNA-binding MarR family transcriptional regulator